MGIEGCGSAHHWARELIKLGHEVILLNARYVKSFVIGNKKLLKPLGVVKLGFRICEISFIKI